MRELTHTRAGLLLLQLPLVVVHRDPGRLGNEARQHSGADHRQPLTGIENEGDARRGELRGVLDHALAPVGRDDADGDVTRLRYTVEVRVLHRSRMERDRKSTRLNSSHSQISYAVFCLKKKK